ncbi:MAG TPA: phosphoribosyltransferase [Solirubrobacteraceae bacterium]|nr:phosphoribosyltransferase [Solirubrobacteraceae bacterium]
MATVTTLSDPYANFLLAPRPGLGVCQRCFNLTDGYDLCFACEHGGDSIDVIAPISYSVAGEQLHHALAGYKRGSMDWMRTLTRQLAAVLWRHLALHEACIAEAAGVARFTQVATVPSGTASRNPPHPLEEIVGTLIEPTRVRHVQLLRRTAHPVPMHSFSADRFAATSELHGEPVLLIDDTWTTGANAQSAAATLKKAGAGPVAVVVIGRHLNRDWGENDRRLSALPTPFDWNRCVCCGPEGGRDALEPASAPPGVEHATPVLPGDR